jgi:hypothetical protein
MGMRCPIDKIGMLVIGGYVALDDKWMFFFIMLLCWLLVVLLTLVVFGYSVHSGY